MISSICKKIVDVDMVCGEEMNVKFSARHMNRELRTQTMKFSSKYVRGQGWYSRVGSTWTVASRQMWYGKWRSKNFPRRENRVSKGKEWSCVLEIWPSNSSAEIPALL